MNKNKTAGSDASAFEILLTEDDFGMDKVTERVN